MSLLSLLLLLPRSLFIELTVNESVKHIETGGGLVVRDHVATFGH
jgi:hypothetical protein